jgi:hypothetical protein
MFFLAFPTHSMGISLQYDIFHFVFTIFERMVQRLKFEPSSNMNWTLSSVQNGSGSKFGQIHEPNCRFSLKFTKYGPEPD